MVDLIEKALTTDVREASETSLSAYLAEVGRQADRIVGAGPAPGTPEWSREADTDIPAVRQTAWQLASLRIQLAVGTDPVETVMSLRRFGTTWATIGEAAGMTRQSAHERWAGPVSAILNRYGEGMPALVADDDPS